MSKIIDDLINGGPKGGGSSITQFIPDINIETRWPRLAIWFKIRTKLQYTYIIFNSILIFFFLGVIIYANLLLLGIITPS